MWFDPMDLMLEVRVCACGFIIDIKKKVNTKYYTVCDQVNVLTVVCSVKRYQMLIKDHRYCKHGITWGLK